MEIKPIAHIRNNFKTKFGIPRQNGLARTASEIVFEPLFASPESVRGLADFSYIWLIWSFSENLDKGWHPTVRPPRLGGNTRMGVFATRSSFRPNGLALSSVRLESVELRKKEGPILHISGADLMNGTPIYDIKPYIPYADCHPEATGGFTDRVARPVLTVSFESGCGSESLPPAFLQELTEILAQDPRPSYQNDPSRIYGLSYGAYNIKFQVVENILTVKAIERSAT